MTCERSTGCISMRDLAADDAAHVEKIFDELGLKVRVSLDVPSPSRDLSLVVPLSGKLRPPQNGIERRAQLVRNRREKLILNRLACSASDRAVAMLTFQQLFTVALLRWISSILGSRIWYCLSRDPPPPRTTLSTVRIGAGRSSRVTLCSACSIWLCPRSNPTPPRISITTGSSDHGRLLIAALASRSSMPSPVDGILRSAGSPLHPAPPRGVDISTESHNWAETWPCTKGRAKSAHRAVGPTSAPARQAVARPALPAAVHYR